MLKSSEREVIPYELAAKIREVESAINTTPVLLASNICAARLWRGFWDRMCFLEPPDPKLQRLIKESGLSTYDPQSITTRGTNFQWLNFLSPFAAYGKKSKSWEMASKFFSLDPGIRIKDLEKNLPCRMNLSYWYSAGGNRLQDLIGGNFQEYEYRANILGLQTLESYNIDLTLPLSELISQAYFSQSSVRGDKYRTSRYHLLSEEYIKPVLGHRVLRRLGKKFPRICEIGLIP